MDPEMHQQLPRDHIPIQMMKDRNHPLPLLQPVLVNKHQPSLRQGKWQYLHQSHQHGRDQPLHDSEHPDMIQKVSEKQVNICLVYWYVYEDLPRNK